MIQVVMASVREHLERGRGMRAQRLTEGGLLLAAFLVGDLRLAYAAFGLLALQVVSPYASPVALSWQLAARRLPPAHFGDMYYDVSGTRGAAAISCLVMGTAFGLIHLPGLATLGWILLAAPCASCILSATVGFCAGCGYYVLGRDLLTRAGVVRGTPEGATDVDLESHQR
jgi:hypothetical protein